MGIQILWDRGGRVALPKIGSRDRAADSRGSPPMVIHAIERGDSSAAITALAKLSPEERRALAPKVFALYERWHAGALQAVSGERSRGFAFVYGDGTDVQREAATLCALSVATADELATNRSLPKISCQADLSQVTRVFFPPWLDEDGLSLLLEARRVDWQFIEALLEAGCCKRPQSARLVESMIETAGRWDDVPLVEVLRRHPLLFEDDVLYRLFNREAGVQSSLATTDRYRNPSSRWSTALLELSSTGELDRSRLLDGCLKALSKDFSPAEADWHLGFLSLLSPDDHEKDVRLAAYAQLTRV